MLLSLPRSLSLSLPSLKISLFVVSVKTKNSNRISLCHFVKGGLHPFACKNKTKRQLRLTCS